jgi:hypothetical protein
VSRLAKAFLARPGDAPWAAAAAAAEPALTATMGASVAAAATAGAYHLLITFTCLRLISAVYYSSLLPPKRSR